MLRQVGGADDHAIAPVLTRQQVELSVGYGLPKDAKTGLPGVDSFQNVKVPFMSLQPHDGGAGVPNHHLLKGQDAH